MSTIGTDRCKPGSAEPLPLVLPGESSLTLMLVIADGGSLGLALVIVVGSLLFALTLLVLAGWIGRDRRE